MNLTLKNQIEKSLALALSGFKNEKETLNFLSDFLTKNELETLSKRLGIAYWLAKKRSYENISTNLNVSSATISEANKLLKKENIQNAIKKIDADAWAEKWSSKIKHLLKQ